MTGLHRAFLARLAWRPRMCTFPVARERRSPAPRPRSDRPTAARAPAPARRSTDCGGCPSGASRGGASRTARQAPAAGQKCKPRPGLSTPPPSPPLPAPPRPESPPPRTALPKPPRTLLPDRRATCRGRAAGVFRRPRAAGRRRSGTAAAGTRTAYELAQGIRVGRAGGDPCRGLPSLR